MKIIKLRWWLSLAGCALTLTIFQNCRPSHYGGTSLSSVGALTCASADAIQGQNLYAQNCAGCHGDYANSQKSGRSFSDIKTAIAGVPAMSTISLSDSDIQAIADALDLGANATTACADSGSSSSSSSSTATMPNVAASTTNFFACNPGDDPGVRDLRRLTKTEYIKTLQLLVGSYFDVTTISLQTDLLPADAITTSSPIFDSTDNTITANHVNAYMSIASTIATNLISNPNFMTANVGCTASGGMTDTCWTKLFGGFGQLVFRRPMTSAEQSAYKTLYADPSLSGSFNDGLSVVLTSMLSSPNFIFKHEVDGTAIAGRTDLLQLSDYELASRLAFWVTGHGPDAQLMSDAASGTLKTSAGYKTVVNRLFASADAKAQLDDFYTQWLGANNMPGPNQTASFYGSVPLASVQSEAAQEVLDFTEYYTWSTAGTYSDLLTSTKNFTRGPALASIYGVSASTTSTASGTTLTYTGKGMTASVGQADGASAWNLYSNGTLTQSVTLTKGTPYTVVLNAKADLLQNVGAAMTLTFDSQAIAAATISSTSYQSYTYTFTPDHATGNLIISFTNDALDQTSGADRNLYVASLSLTPQTTTSATTTTTNFDATQRAGILTRVALLLGATDRTGLVHRGLLGRRNVLCDPISPPVIPAGQASVFAAPVPDPVLSQREQIEQRTSPTQCQACHSMLNPMGFSLENYDSLGRFRVQEAIFDSSGNLIASHPINAVVEPNIQASTEANVNNGVEMSQAIAGSQKGPACLVKQYFVFAQKRMWTAADSCSLNAEYSQLLDKTAASASGDTPGTILNLFKSTVFEQTFSVRKVGPQ